MGDNTKLVPEIRFNGYTDAWVQRKLGDALSEKISNGIMNQPGRNTQNIKHINVVNLYSHSFIHLDELEYADVGMSELKRCNVQVGDIFLTRSSLKVEGIAQANILLDVEKLVFDDHIMRLKLVDEFEPFFVKESLNHVPMKKQFMTKSKTGTMTTIGQDDISSSIFSYPTKPEQTAIGEFFRTLDTAITLYQRKLDGLRELKKGYLQQMFPKADEHVPRVRFAGYTDDWEQRKLGEVCATFADGDWIESKDQSNEGIRLLQTGNVGVNEFIDRTDRAKWISEDTFIRLKCTEVYPGDILISRLPEPAGRACIVPDIGQKMITAVDCTIVRTSEKCVSEYLVQVLSSQFYFKTVNDFLAGGTRQRISKSNLAGFTVPLPRKEEQKEIGQFFTSLDHLITLHQRKAAELKTIKTAYLQKMFV